jgi:UDP-glucose 4-epimerase
MTVENAFKNKVVLCTGGAGFIGSHLCDAIMLQQPKKLIILDDLSASNLDNIVHLLKDNRVEFVEQDTSNYEKIEPYVLESDIIFHLAANNVGNSILHPRIDYKTNIIGTFNILEAVRKKPSIKMIHVSSGSVENPSTPYAISKQAGENYARFYAHEYKLNIAIIRYYHVFGKRQDMKGKCGVINIFLSRILKGLPPVVWGDGQQIKCFTFVTDSVRATMMVATDDDTAGRTYDIASNTRININDLAKLLIKRYAQDKNMKPEYADAKIGENMILHPDIHRIKMLGWKPEYTFNQGLDATYNWVKENI